MPQNQTDVQAGISPEQGQAMRRPGFIRPGSIADRLFRGLMERRGQNRPQPPAAPRPTTTPGQVTGEHQADIGEAAQSEAEAGMQDVQDTGQEIAGTTEDMVSEAEQDRARIDEAAAEGQGAIEEQRQELSNLPAEVQDVMNEYLDRFQEQADAGLDEMRSMAERAIEAAEYGRTSAMEAATESIQGAMRSSIEQINADPTLPPTVKQQMINQVRVGGATKMSAAIGQTAHQFAQTTASTITNAMGQIGSVMNTATSVGGTLTGQAMGQVGAAHQAAAQLGTALTQLETGLSQWEADSQRAVTTSINQARAMGNDWQLRMLDERQDARSMLTDVRLLDYELAHRAASEDLDYFFRSQGYTMMQDMVSQGNRAAFLQNVMAGMQSGGFAGGIFNAVLGALA